MLVLWKHLILDDLGFKKIKYLETIFFLEELLEK